MTSKFAEDIYILNLGVVPVGELKKTIYDVAGKYPKSNNCFLWVHVGSTSPSFLSNNYVYVVDYTGSISEVGGSVARHSKKENEILDKGPFDCDLYGKVSISSIRIYLPVLIDNKSGIFLNFVDLKNKLTDFAITEASKAVKLREVSRVIPYDILSSLGEDSRGVSIFYGLGEGPILLEDLIKKQSSNKDNLQKYIFINLYTILYRQNAFVSGNKKIEEVIVKGEKYIGGIVETKNAYTSLRDNSLGLDSLLSENGHHFAERIFSKIALGFLKEHTTTPISLSAQGGGSNENMQFTNSAMLIRDFIHRIVESLFVQRSSSVVSDYGITCLFRLWRDAPDMPSFYKNRDKIDFIKGILGDIKDCEAFLTRNMADNYDVYTLTHIDPKILEGRVLDHMDSLTYGEGGKILPKDFVLRDEVVGDHFRLFIRDNRKWTKKE